MLPAHWRAWNSRLKIGMTYDDERLAHAKRRVAEAKRAVARYIALIARLKAAGSPTGDAEQTLQTLVQSLAVFEDDLRELQNKIRGESRWHTNGT
jgi:hypothetical protein